MEAKLKERLNQLEQSLNICRKNHKGVSKTFRYSEEHKQEVVNLIKTGISRSILSKQLSLTSERISIWTQQSSPLAKNTSFKQLSIKQNLQKSEASFLQSCSEARIETKNNINIFIPINLVNGKLIANLEDS
jgi:transposase-like protein